MFYYLRGQLTHLTGDTAVIDCGGVGYKLSVSATTAGKSAPLYGKEATLFTYLSVREDAMELFGFADEEELQLFKMLISVSGIGPKGAIAVLGTFPVESFREIVYSGDHKTLSRAPGIGPKTAQRIIMELKDKVGPGDLDESLSSDAPSAGGQSVKSQVVDTLLLYGFDRQQIERALKSQDLTKPLEELLADTLRLLASK